MKNSRLIDSQIMAILKQAEIGTAAPVLCREHGINSATFYKWRSKFGGMDVSLMAKMEELEGENRRLKKPYFDAQMRAQIVEEALAKSNAAISSEGNGQGCGNTSRCSNPFSLYCFWHQ